MGANFSLCWRGEHAVLSPPRVSLLPGSGVAPVSRAVLGARGVWQVSPRAIPSLQSSICAWDLFCPSGVWESPVWGDKCDARGTFWSAQNLLVALFEQEETTLGMEERREGLGEGGGTKPSLWVCRRSCVGSSWSPNQGGGDVTHMSQIPSQSALG